MPKPKSVKSLLELTAERIVEKGRCLGNKVKLRRRKIKVFESRILFVFLYNGLNVSMRT